VGDGDESSAICEDSNAWCACRGHELLYAGRSIFARSEAAKGGVETWEACYT
jgi:hypothetical protein